VSAAGASEAPPATRLQLEVVAGNAAGTVIGVGEQLVFGRQTEGYGQLANDPELSRHHAEVSRLPTGEYRLEDLSSTNGTFVNGARLQAPAVLALGDEIELGSSKLVVRALPAVAAPPAGTVDVRAATVVVDVPAGVRAAAPAAEPEPPPPPPPLELRLRVDLEHQEAEVALEQGPSVRLRLQDGSWRIVGDDSR
jgi:pSer/pThr/pTyr-binding forkhead associated (FHA) protein